MFLTQSRLLVGIQTVCSESRWLVKNLAFEIMYKDILTPVGAIQFCIGLTVKNIIKNNARKNHYVKHYSRHLRKLYRFHD